MPRKRKDSEVPSSWKREPQKLKKTSKNKKVRKETPGWVVVLILFLLLSGGLYYCFSQGVISLPKLPERAEVPAGEILVKVDVTGASNIPADAIVEEFAAELDGELGSISVFGLKRSLEGKGQILEAQIYKDYPSNLRIEITERQPVVMLATLDDSGETQFWAVDKEGVVFKPHDLARIRALDLPFIEGVELDSISDGVTSIDGMVKVHHLLQLLQRDIVPVHEDIRRISLEDYREGESELGSVIILKGKLLKKVIFGVENLEFQVVKLMHGLSKAGESRLRKTEVIDLSHGSDAVFR